MSMTLDPIDRLALATEWTGAVIAGIRPDQAEQPTPCPDWDVGALVQHVVRDVLMFTARAGGLPWEEETPTLSSDEWPDAYQDAADALVKEWQNVGSLDQAVTLPFGEVPRSWFVGQQIADLVVHGWDLAVATGQPTDADADLAGFALDWGRQNLKPEYRGKEFGPEVDVLDDAEPVDRLVGFFGRDPGWAPPEA